MLRGRHTRVLVCTATSVHPSLLHKCSSPTGPRSRQGSQRRPLRPAGLPGRSSAWFVVCVCVCGAKEGGATGEEGGGGE